MNTHIKALVAALLFSLLFYGKDFGINLILFATIVTALLLTAEKKPPIGYVFPYLFTALMVFFDPTAFKVFIHFTSFLILIGKTIEAKSAIYLSFFMGLVNMFTASFSLLNTYQKKPESERKSISPRLKNMLKGILVSVVFAVLFSFLYKSANPVFEGLIEQINLNFISFNWVLFTIMGYFIALHILRPYHPEKLIAIDKAQKNVLTKSAFPFDFDKKQKLTNEHSLGSYIFATLNLLLVFYLITDAIYLGNSNTTSNAEFSAAVHKGIYALLFSIICAIAIILYFFRGDLNFFEKNKILKNLSYTWLLLNVILVLFTCYKNYTYVEALGLTYKRIGVFIYLLLVLFGLCTTYIKVAKLKSFIYLVRTNIALWATVLLLSSTIAWDRAITYYNLNFIQHPDMEYLIRLGATNSQQLKEYASKESNLISKNASEKVAQKYQSNLEDINQKSWQEYTIYHFKLK